MDTRTPIQGNHCRDSMLYCRYGIIRSRFYSDFWGRVCHWLCGWKYISRDSSSCHCKFIVNFRIWCAGRTELTTKSGFHLRIFWRHASTYSKKRVFDIAFAFEVCVHRSFNWFNMFFPLRKVSVSGLCFAARIFISYIPGDWTVSDEEASNAEILIQSMFDVASFTEDTDEMRRIPLCVLNFPRALETNGLKIMVLLRLSPLIPFNALDYISGITSISLRDYALALLAILPGAIVLCIAGASASSLSDRTSSNENSTIKIISIVVGLVSGGYGVYLASYYSKMELDRVSSATVLL